MSVSRLACCEAEGRLVVMAAWLLQLRSRLLLPADAQAEQDATVEADQLLGRLVALQAMQALAAWLERRPQLGRDIFVRGQPEILSVSVEPTPDLDVIEFLWASLALFDDGEPAPNTGAVYRPPPLPLYPVGEARTRIRRLLAEAPGEVAFEMLLPDMPDPAESEALPALQRRSAWSSTLVASLELAKQGDVVLAQEGHFSLYISLASEGRRQTTAACLFRQFPGVAVVLATGGSAATCLAIMTLFLFALSNRTIAGVLPMFFGLAVLCTLGSVAAFGTEMVLSNRVIRRRINFHLPRLNWPHHRSE